LQSSITKFIASEIAFNDSGFRRMCEVFCKNSINEMSLGLVNNKNLKILIEKVQRSNLKNLSFECNEKGGWDLSLLSEFIKEFK
jgi:hypothetical protein